MTGTQPSTKRRQILAAALQVFAEKGFHNAKIEEIAQVAQVGKGTVYEYFQSKNQLFQEMLIAGVTAFDQSLHEELAGEETTRGKLRVLISKTLELGRNYRPLAKIAFMEHHILDSSFREWFMELYCQRVQLIEGIVQEGIAKGEFRPINAKLFSSLFYTALGALHSPLADYDPEPKDTQNMVEEIIDYIYHGIAL